MNKIQKVCSVPAKVSYTSHFLKQNKLFMERDNPQTILLWPKRGRMRKSLCADRTIHDWHNSAIHYERCYSQSESPYGRHYGFLCLLNSITGMPITPTPAARRNTTERLIAINAKLILAASDAANIRDAALHLSLHKLVQSVESFFSSFFFPLSPKGIHTIQSHLVQQTFPCSLAIRAVC